MTELEHFGVKGMKWGVRKERPDGFRSRYNEIRNGPRASVKVKTKSGDIVEILENRRPVVSAVAGALSPNARKVIEASKTFDLNVNGKKVGDASFDRVSKNELNLVWLGINREHRGKGYATGVFAAAVEYGKQSGASKLTLEVPGNSPDARHIYEKQGFVATGKTKGVDEDGVWGGLTNMEYRFDQPKKLKHSDDEADFERVLIETFAAKFNNMNPYTGDSVMDDDIAHYGVKGMHWGVRKSSDSGPVSVTVKQKKPGGRLQTTGGQGHPAHPDAIKTAEINRKAQKSRVSSLSNKELQESITRMNLERQYNSLAGQTMKAKAQKFVAEMILNQGKQQVNRKVNEAVTEYVKTKK